MDPNRPDDVESEPRIDVSRLGPPRSGSPFEPVRIGAILGKQGLFSRFSEDKDEAAEAAEAAEADSGTTDPESDEATAPSAVTADEWLADVEENHESDAQPVAASGSQPEDAVEAAPEGGPNPDHAPESTSEPASEAEPRREIVEAASPVWSNAVLEEVQAAEAEDEVEAMGPEDEVADGHTEEPADQEPEDSQDREAAFGLADVGADHHSGPAIDPASLADALQVLAELESDGPSSNDESSDDQPVMAGRPENESVTDVSPSEDEATETVADEVDGSDELAVAAVESPSEDAATGAEPITDEIEDIEDTDELAAAADESPSEDGVVDGETGTDDAGTAEEKADEVALTVVPPVEEPPAAPAISIAGQDTVDEAASEATANGESPTPGDQPVPPRWGWQPQAQADASVEDAATYGGAADEGASDEGPSEQAQADDGDGDAASKSAFEPDVSEEEVSDEDPSEDVVGERISGEEPATVDSEADDEGPDDGATEEGTATNQVTLTVISSTPAEADETSDEDENLTVDIGAGQAANSAETIEAVEHLRAAEDDDTSSERATADATPADESDNVDPNDHDPATNGKPVLARWGWQPKVAAESPDEDETEALHLVQSDDDASEEAAEEVAAIERPVLESVADVIHLEPAAADHSDTTDKDEESAPEDPADVADRPDADFEDTDRSEDGGQATATATATAAGGLAADGGAELDGNTVDDESDTMPSMDDLRAMAAELDEVDAILERLDSDQDELLAGIDLTDDAELPLDPQLPLAADAAHPTTADANTADPNMADADTTVGS